MHCTKRLAGLLLATLIATAGCADTPTTAVAPVRPVFDGIGTAGSGNVVTTSADGIGTAGSGNRTQSDSTTTEIAGIGTAGSGN